MELDELKKNIDEEAKKLVEAQPEQKSVVQNSTPSFNELQSKYLQEQINNGKDIANIATDFTKAKVTSDILNNEDGSYDKLHKQLADEQRQTLLESFKQDKIAQQTQTITEGQKKAEAFYMSVRPILEFDFSNLIKSKPKKGEDVQSRSYSERSYGIPLMCLMLILFVVPYCAVSMILAVACGVNAVCEAIATFGKISRSIVLTLFIISLVVLMAYCVVCGVDALFGTNIINNYIK